MLLITADIKTHRQISLRQIECKFEVFIKSLPSEPRKPHRRVRRKGVRDRIDGEHQKNMALNQSNKTHMNSLTETETASTDLNGSAPGPLYTYYSYQLDIFKELLTVRMSVGL